MGGTASGAGNIISGNASNGIAEDAPGALIAGNFIGLNETGSSAVPNVGYAIAVGATSVTIGGTVAAARNVISGNAGPAAIILESTGVLVEGNDIGTDSTGAVAVPNSGIGVWDDGESNNTIGGLTAGAANVISANISDGVSIFHAIDDVVAGNWIGTNATGTAALGNHGDGVDVTGSTSITVGGTSAGAGNLISDNATGIEIDDSSMTLVQGNLIGLDQTGTLALGNTGAGIQVDSGSSANTVGGPVAGGRNFISGNGEGVFVTGAATTSTLIAGDLIGTDLKGTVPVGNGTAGIELTGGAATTIGGTTILARNLISGNDGRRN